MSTRLIHRSAARPNRMISETVALLFTAELIAPGNRLMIVTPWISDVPILDNRCGGLSSLEPSWASTTIRLSKVLRVLLQKDVSVQISCGPGIREDNFLGVIKEMAGRDGSLDSLTIRRASADRYSEFDHEKAVIADNWAVFGSMNLTYRGVELNGELVTVTRDLQKVAEVATALSGLFQ